MAAAAVLLARCGKKNGAGAAGQDSTGRDLSLAPVDSGAPLNDVAQAAAESASVTAPPPLQAPPPNRPSAASPAKRASTPPPAPVLVAGTNLAMSGAIEFSTKTDNVGQKVAATVSADVTDATGRVVIPAGAIVGRILGGKKKGTVVGGVIGAAAGTAVAVNSADRDVVVSVGSKIILKLKSLFEAKS